MPSNRRNTIQSYHISTLLRTWRSSRSFGELSQNNELDTVSYAAEAGQFAEGGYPAVICGPGDIAQARRADEFVAKDQLAKGVEMLERLVVRLS
ncbi:MAG: hypothetical protein AAGC88_04085 [Bacteroidota bacterium]